MLRILIPICIGIYLSKVYPIPIYMAYIFCFVLVVGFAFIHFRFSLLHIYKYAGLELACLFFLLVGVGYITHHNYQIKNHQLYFAHEDIDTAHIVKILSPPIKKKKTIQIVAKVIANSKHEKRIGKLILYIEKNVRSKSLVYGDILLIGKQLTKVKSSPNPILFDYAKYLTNKNIYHLDYLMDDQWTRIGHKPHWFWIHIYSSKAYIHRILNKCIPDRTTKAIVAALLMGDKSDLSISIRRDYVQSGAMHILAVSGLHVGVLSVIALWLLGYKKNRLFPFYKIIIVMAIIWMYAAITGLSASVIRASIMFTLIIIGISQKRTMDMYNIIATSALVILIVKPNFLFDIGFQLSYAATTGIFFFYPRLYSIWNPKNVYVDRIWRTICVSTAAQITAGPIQLYYFNEISLLGIGISFWLVICTSFIMYGGILLLCIGSIKNMGGIIGEGITYIVYLLNYVISMVKQVHLFRFENIGISKLQVVTLLALAISWGLWLSKKNYRWTLLSLICLCLYICSDTYKRYQTARQDLVCIYHVANHTVIQIIKGRHSVMYEQPILKSAMYERHIAPTQNIYRVSDIKDIVEVNEFENIAVLNRLTCVDDLKQKKYALLSHNPNISLKVLIDKIHPIWIIIDGSNDKSKVDYWLEYIEKHKIQVRVHNTYEDGCFMRYNY